ncbi:MAG: single-stranded DNA-binding protein [Candidatus Kapabacteria bacterium]|nr:single-stranded DNA-binding protein [Ignavibacteriota bacterium]MCW5885951.1 single-stranded DNA-binding protein [Candidatus Kapabacteria bacterium]
MAISVNKVILVGNLGKDPELRSTPQGKSVCTFSIATSERYLDKASNEWKDATEWHNVVLWERLAEYWAQRLKKGSKAYIEGSLRHRSYEKDGVTRYTTEVLGREVVSMEKVEGGSSYSGGSSSGGYSGGYGGSANVTSSSPAPTKSYDPPSPDYDSEVSDDDEVPF